MKIEMINYILDGFVAGVTGFYRRMPTVQKFAKSCACNNTLSVSLIMLIFVSGCSTERSVIITNVRFWILLVKLLWAFMNLPNSSCTAAKLFLSASHVGWYLVLLRVVCHMLVALSNIQNAIFLNFKRG